MVKLHGAALLLALCLAGTPVCAEEYLTGSLIKSRSAQAGPVTPKILSTGIYGEQYAALPDRTYLVLPPAESPIPQPVVERTGAGTYRYRYAGAAGKSDAGDRAVAAIITSFEMADGDQSVTLRLEKGTQKLYGSYDQKEAKRLFTLLNEQRKAAGIPALSWDPSLAEGARVRAAELSVKQSHGRPDGTQFTTAAEGVEAENYLCGYASADIAMARMMELPGQKENVLREKFTIVGAAAFESDQRSYWVLEFGR